MRFTLFASICIVIFIFLQLVSGADRDDNGEGRKLHLEKKFLRVPKMKGLQCEQTLKVDAREQLAFLLLQFPCLF